MESEITLSLQNGSPLWCKHCPQGGSVKGTSIVVMLSDTSYSVLKSSGCSNLRCEIMEPRCKWGLISGGDEVDWTMRVRIRIRILRSFDPSRAHIHPFLSKMSKWYHVPCCLRTKQDYEFISECESVLSRHSPCSADRTWFSIIQPPLLFRD